MTSIIRQLVDVDENSSDYDSIVKAALYEFWLKNKDSSQEELVEQAEMAKTLFMKDELRRSFYEGFRYAQILAGGFANWSVLIKNGIVLSSKRTGIKVSVIERERLSTSYNF